MTRTISLFEIFVEYSIFKSQKMNSLLSMTAGNQKLNLGYPYFYTVKISWQTLLYVYS
jgi:hypothetical protein